MEKKLNEYGNNTIVRVGDIVWGWCSRCGDRTDHLYTGHSLVCLGCNPEQRPTLFAAGDDEHNHE